MKKVCVYRGLPSAIQPLLELLEEKGISYRVKKPLIPSAMHDYGTVYSRTPLQTSVLKDLFNPEDNIELLVREEDEKTVRRLLEEQENENDFLK